LRVARNGTLDWKVLGGVSGMIGEGDDRATPAAQGHPLADTRRITTPIFI
jgi:hypothetical protein